MKEFQIAQFICAVILLLCTATGTVLSIKKILSLPDGIVIAAIYIAIIALSAILVKMSAKALK